MFQQPYHETYTNEWIFCFVIIQETISENDNKEANYEGDEEQQIQVNFVRKPEAATVGVLLKKLLLKMLQISQENTCEICRIFKNTYF